MKDKNPCPCSGNSIVRSKGEFTIVVIRRTFKLNVDLPYCLWGTIYLNGKNFATPLQNFLPAGITVTSTINASNVIIFSYTDGVDTDTIEVLGLPTNQVDYLEMLANLNTNYLKTELVYYNCNTSKNPPLLTDSQITDLQQQPLYMQKIGGLSSKDTQSIIPLTRKLPNNTIKDIIELSMRKQDIKPETVWVHIFANVMMTEPKKLVFYWQIIINDIVNMNEERGSLQDIKENAQ